MSTEIPSGLELASGTVSTTVDKTEVGSYFISNYPPYSRWSSEAIPNLQQTFAARPNAVPLGLYLHIPFCRKRCKFCYFRVYTDKNAKDIESYVAAMCREIELVSQLPVMGERPFRFVYFGGGTPSYLAPKQLISLVDRLRANINWDQAEEVTFECEPGTLSKPKLETLRDLGITRISLGVENFSDAVLEENGRAHLSGEIATSWQWIQDLKFPSTNIDLIAGMVGETPENWQENIRRTLELQPDSVTIYQLELPFNTVYSKDMLGHTREIPVADWPTKRAWMQYAYETLQAAGYSISSAYTLVKDPSRVKFSYRDHLWRGSDLLAVGVASFGHVSGMHYQNLTEWEPYLAALDQGELPLSRAYRMNPRELLIREMILQLKTGRLQTSYFKQKFDVDIFREWEPVWQRYVAQGFVQLDPQEIRLTKPGLLRVDGLLPSFFDPEHQGVRYT